MSVIAELSKAVAASLNAQEFTPAVTAQRTHLPIFDLARVGESIHVNVVSRAVLIVPASRSTNTFDLAVDIGVQRRVLKDDIDGIDMLHDLVEQINDHLRLKRLDTMLEAQWISSENDPVLAPEHLEQLGVFTSVLTVTYRIAR